MDRFLVLHCETSVSSDHYLTKAQKDYKCFKKYGHLFLIKIELECHVLNLPTNGMMLDFSSIKKEVVKLDHALLNKYIDTPTCENICIYLSDKIEKILPEDVILKKIRVQESSGNSVEWG